jgi:hypothetical protein
MKFCHQNKNEKCLNGLSLILMEAWDLSDRAGAEHPTDKIHALELAKKAYTTKLDLLTNISVIEIKAGLSLRRKRN